MSASATPRRSPTEWFALATQQRASGLSIAEFARREGLVYQTFVAWCRRASRSDDAVAATSATRPLTDAPPPSALPGFIELGVNDAIASDQRVADTATADWLVELDLGDGVQLRVRRAA